VQFDVPRNWGHQICKVRDKSHETQVAQHVVALLPAIWFNVAITIAEHSQRRTAISYHIIHVVFSLLIPRLLLLYYYYSTTSHRQRKQNKTGLRLVLRLHVDPRPLIHSSSSSIKEWLSSLKASLRPSRSRSSSDKLPPASRSAADAPASFTRVLDFGY